MKDKETLSLPEEPRPAWISVSDMQFHFGIGKTKCYELINERQIESRELKVRGKKRGKRLINYNSVNAFVAGLPS